MKARIPAPSASSCSLATLLAALALALAAPSALGAGGGIAGRVTAAATHKPLEGIEVCVLANSPQGVEEEAEGEGSCVRTAAGGEYTIAGLGPGSYTVGFGDPLPSTLDYVAQYYDGKASPAEATPVNVSAAATTEKVDAELEEGAEISGTLTNASTGAPAEGAGACAVRVLSGATVEPLGCATAAADGSYTISGLPSGNVEVLFGSSVYVYEYYNGVSSVTEATPLSLAPQEHRSGIDATLQLRPEQSITTQFPTASGPVHSPLGETLGVPTKALSLQSNRLSVKRPRSAIVKLHCSGSLACHGNLALSERHTLRRDGKTLIRTVALGSLAFSLRAGQTAAVTIKLDAAAVRALAAARGQLDARLTITQLTPAPAHASNDSVLLIEPRRAARKS